MPEPLPQKHENLFYELMHQAYARKDPYPFPWWVQQYMRRWPDHFDGGLFDSKQAAFSSNAYYRYWSMIGVKDHHQETLIGQAGEIEPVYDKYALSFFVFDPASRQLHFPQTSAAPGHISLDQHLAEQYLPVVKTTYRSPAGPEVEATAFATVFGDDHKSVVVAQYLVKAPPSPAPDPIWFCLALLPAGPTGFQRRDKAGRYLQDRRIAQVQLDASHKLVKVNAAAGPVFQTAPDHFGLYGNGGTEEVTHYLQHNPFQDLAQQGRLNQMTEAHDWVGGLCTAVFAWEVTPSLLPFKLEVKLPVDDYRGQAELTALSTADGGALKENNERYWKQKLNQYGLQFVLPPALDGLMNLYKICRANLLILADQGQIHPGPTIYDEFWIRDSAIEGIAAALAGDTSLAVRQFGTHYPNRFNLDLFDRRDGVSLYGFFGGRHEKDDREWDSNGQALWAIGRLDRILGRSVQFGGGLYNPYILLGARWIRDNRSEYGLLHSGWSAEHVGDKDKPHFWDDFWGIAGLYEAARLAERIGALETNEIWSIYHDLRVATTNAIRHVLRRQAQMGHWETFIPTGPDPADVGKLSSVIIGALAYFHPCRLYMGNKLEPDIDWAARMTLETIWHHFVRDGGFRHDASWNAFGPYLTLQLAHAFLLTGDLNRVQSCLNWASNAAFAPVSRSASQERWKGTLGAWNEQHCYPISNDFDPASFPNRSWYMGDIPHGWACAEYMMLLRDMLFFEADEDGNPHIFLAPGLQPHWLMEGGQIQVTNAPTIFDKLFGYKLEHDPAARKVSISILQPPPPGVGYRFTCPFGTRLRSLEIDGQVIRQDTEERKVWIAPGSLRIVVEYD